MKHGTKIEWTHFPGFKGETWTPWGGCTKVSEGCKNCWALRQACRFQRLPQYEGTVKDGNWTGRVNRVVGDGFYKPLHWRDPRAIFPCSMSDFFHPGADEWREQIWHTIYDTPQHLYLILTKRSERIPECLPSFGKSEWPWPNVWLGVTVENQEMAEKRIPGLLMVPAAKRFLSVEPMLGPIDLSKWIGYNTIYENTKRENDLRGSKDGRTSNRRAGANLEDSQANWGARENGNDNAPLQKGESRSPKSPGLHDHQGDVQQEETPDGCPSAGVATLQRRDSGRHDHQSQERDETRQPSSQSGINDLRRTATPRFARSESGKDRPERREECDGKTHTRTSSGDSGTPPQRGAACEHSPGLRRGIQGDFQDCPRTALASRFWIIAGGESGPGARPCHPAWLRSIRDQCQAAEVPFFMKQHGEWKPSGWFGKMNPKKHFTFPDGQKMVRVGKKEAGRLLDGRTWDEFPHEQAS